VDQKDSTCPLWHQAPQQQRCSTGPLSSKGRGLYPERGLADLGEVQRAGRVRRGSWIHECPASRRRDRRATTRR